MAVTPADLAGSAGGIAVSARSAGAPKMALAHKGLEVETDTVALHRQG